jgi:hypothetical protein
MFGYKNMKIYVQMCRFQVCRFQISNIADMQMCKFQISNVQMILK